MRLYREPVKPRKWRLIVDDETIEVIYAQFSPGEMKDLIREKAYDLGVPERYLKLIPARKRPDDPETT